MNNRFIGTHCREDAFSVTGWLVTLALLLLAGCASIAGYSISEQTLEGYARQAVQKFDQDQLKAGSPLSLSVNKLDLTLAPEGRQVVQLDLKGQVALNTVIMKVPVDIALKIEGAPIYDGTEKAIFLKRLNVLESEAKSPFFNQNFQPAIKQSIAIISQILETVPVYRLNEQNLSERLLMMTDLSIHVAEDRLVIAPVGQ